MHWFGDHRSGQLAVQDVDIVCRQYNGFPLHDDQRRSPRGVREHDGALDRLGLDPVEYPIVAVDTVYLAAKCSGAKSIGRLD